MSKQSPCSSKTADRPLVTVIMVPREQFSCTRESIESLYANTDKPFDFIFMDNNSPEPTAGYLRQAAIYRGFRLLRVDHYISPNQSRNIGLNHARTKYVAFVDNDVAFTPGWLSRLIDCAEDTGAEVVGPLMCQFEPLHEIIHCAGGQIMAPEELRRFLEAEDAAFVGRSDNRPTFRIDEKIHKQGVKVADEIHRDRQETGFIEFHCCLVRRDIFNQIGPLDEKMMSTKEHLDFCLAVQRAGGRIVLEPKVVVTYFAFAGERSLKLNELPFYFLRWSDRWHQTSLKHLKEKWNLENDQYFSEKLAIGTWRRQKALLNVLMRIFPRSNQSVEHVLRPMLRVLHPIERVFNNIYSRRSNGQTQQVRIVAP